MSLSARIVEAADNERRRIAADLHDGLQARLVLLAIRANGLRATAGPDAAALESGLQAAIDELRELVQGLMPAALSERGLFAAINDLVDRTPIPTAIDLDDDGTPLPRAVENSAYFVVSEAIANAVKHAHARRLAIRLAHGDGRLLILISDDGIGGANRSGGCGLRGMADRVNALDGRLFVQSPPGAGTRIAVELPTARQPR
jgi:signal transduction histidine kinase